MPTGNHDAYGKNFSLLYGGRNPVLALFYDLLVTAIYPQLMPKLAIKPGSKYKFSELEARHWEKFAEEAGLAKAATRKRLQQLATYRPSYPPPPASCRPRHCMVLRAMPWCSRSFN